MKRRSSSPSRRSRSPSGGDFKRKAFKDFKDFKKVFESEEYTEFGSGQIHCKVCAIIIHSWSQYTLHKEGSKHQKKLKEKNSQIDRKNGSNVAQFGKFFCHHCEKAFSIMHHHCEDCKIFCPTKGHLEQHYAGKAHNLKVKTLRKMTSENKTSPKSKAPPSSASEVKVDEEKVQQLRSRLTQNKSSQPTLDDTSFTATSTSTSSLVCHALGCDAAFSTESELRRHIRSLHGFLIKCAECVSMKQTPAEVLTCQELIQHYEEVHNKVMKDYDLKYFGDVKNWKQGYVKCKLCPTKLGSAGLWFTNELDLSVIAAHFKSKHPNTKPANQISLGCQLCSFKVQGSACYSWMNHLATHAPETPDDSKEDPQIESTGSCSGVVTSPCVFCGEKVAGNAEQKHIETQHQELAFQCKLCEPGSRYYYSRKEEVLTHLRLKHISPHLIPLMGKEESYIKFPGPGCSNGNFMLGFAWIKCKNCEFSGIGLSSPDLIRNHLRSHEISDHLLSSSQILARNHGRGIKFFNIFCRLCHKDDRAVDVFESVEEFKNHMKQKHSELLKMRSDLQR